jgi:hypothetical protein
MDIRYYAEVDFSVRQPDIDNPQQGIYGSILRVCTGDVDITFSDGRVFKSGMLTEDGIDSISTNVDIDDGGEFSLSDGGSIILHNAEWFFDFVMENKIFLFNARVNVYCSYDNNLQSLGRFSVKSFDSTEEQAEITLKTYFSWMTGSVPDSAMPFSGQGTVNSSSLPVTIGKSEGAKLIRVKSEPYVYPSIFLSNLNTKTSRTYVWGLYEKVDANEYRASTATTLIKNRKQLLETIGADEWDEGYTELTQLYFRCLVLPCGSLNNPPFILPNTYVRVVSGKGEGKLYSVDRVEIRANEGTLYVWLKNQIPIFMKATVVKEGNTKSWSFTYDCPFKFAWNYYGATEATPQGVGYSAEVPANEDWTTPFFNSKFLNTLVEGKTGYDSDCSLIDMVSYDMSLLVADSEIESFDGDLFYIDSAGIETKVVVNPDALKTYGAWETKYAGLSLLGAKIDGSGKVFTDVNIADLLSLNGLYFLQNYNSGVELSLPWLTIGYGEGSSGYPSINTTTCEEGIKTRLFSEYGTVLAPASVLRDPSTLNIITEEWPDATKYLITVDQFFRFTLKVDPSKYKGMKNIVPVFFIDSVTRAFNLENGGALSTPLLSWYDTPDYCQNDGTHDTGIEMERVEISFYGIDFTGKPVGYGDKKLFVSYGGGTGTIYDSLDWWRFGVPANSIAGPQVGAFPAKWFTDQPSLLYPNASSNLFYNGDYVDSVNLDSLLTNSDAQIQGIVFDFKVRSKVLVNKGEYPVKAVAWKFLMRTIGLVGETEIPESSLYVPVTGQKWSPSDPLAGAPITIPEVILFLLTKYGKVPLSDVYVPSFNSLLYGRLSELKVGFTYTDVRDVREEVTKLCKLGCVSVYINPKNGLITLKSWIDDIPTETDLPFNPSIFKMDSFTGIEKPSRSSITTRIDFQYRNIGGKFTRGITISKTNQLSLPLPDESDDTFINPNNSISSSPIEYTDGFARLFQFNGGNTEFLYQWCVAVPYTATGYWSGVKVGQKITFKRALLTAETYNILAVYPTNFTPVGWTSPLTLLRIDKPWSISTVGTVVNTGFNINIPASESNLPSGVMYDTGVLTEITLKTSTKKLESYFTGIDLTRNAGIAGEIWEECAKGWYRSETSRIQKVVSSEWIWSDDSALFAIQRWAKWETFQHDTTSVKIPLTEWVKTSYGVMNPVWFEDPILCPQGRGGWITSIKISASDTSVIVGITFFVDPREVNPVRIILDEGAGNIDGSAFPSVDEDETANQYDEQGDFT